MSDLFSLLDSYYPEMVSTRRYLHENPELSFKEYETAKFIQNFYQQLNIPFKSNFGWWWGYASVTWGGLAPVKKKVPGTFCK